MPPRLQGWSSPFPSTPRSCWVPGGFPWQTWQQPSEVAWLNRCGQSRAVTHHWTCQQSWRWRQANLRPSNRNLSARMRSSVDFKSELSDSWFIRIQMHLTSWLLKKWHNPLNYEEIKSAIAPTLTFFQLQLVRCNFHRTLCFLYFNEVRTVGFTFKFQPISNHKAIIREAKARLNSKCIPTIWGGRLSIKLRRFLLDGTMERYRNGTER